MLEITGLHAHYGNIEALRGVSLHVERGKIVSIIGANGAGKSTLLMTICGRPKASDGQIMFDGELLNDLAPHEIVGRGIAQAPEGRRIFPSMSVLENLQMGAVPTNGAFFEEIAEINRERGVTILLVEQNAYQALRIASRGYVLATGRVVLEGSGRELL